MLGELAGDLQEQAGRGEEADRAWASRRPTPTLDPATLAAWTMLANALMNLDEVLNK